MSRRPRLGQANPALGTLYNAPDLQESRRLRGGIAEIAADLIETEGRLEDRLQLEVESLKSSIERHGQRVPVLLRPLPGGRYRLIYGRRRLEACRQLGRPVRALVTDLEPREALKDQLLENLERRDLSFIERATVAAALLEGDHFAEPERTARAVAEILNLTEAGVSQLLGVVRALDPALVQAIGAAPAIGRPRWEALKKSVIGQRELQQDLVARALKLRGEGLPSEEIFAAVLAQASPRPAKPAPAPVLTPAEGSVALEKIGRLRLRQDARGRRLQLDLHSDETGFLAWMHAQAAGLITELHDRWKRSEDPLAPSKEEARDR